MLRTCAAPPWVAVAFPLSLVSFKRADFRGAWRGFCNLGLYCADVELGFGVANILHTGDKIGGNLKSSSTFALLGEMNEAACLISMVFKLCHPKPQGLTHPQSGDHAYPTCYPQGAVGFTSRPQERPCEWTLSPRGCGLHT